LSSSPRWASYLRRYTKNSSKVHWRNRSVWIPCTSQHDIAMYEANGPRDH
jgi:hypothetical protein